MHLLFNSREYSIEKRLLNEELQLKDLANNNYRCVPQELLVNALFKGDLQILGTNQETSFIVIRQEEKLIEDFTQLPEKLRNITKRRYAYVKALVDKGIDKYTKEILTPIIVEVGQSINEEVLPYWTTVYRWFRNYLSSGEDIRSLVPSIRTKGNRQRKLELEVLRIIEEVIKESYLKLERPGVSSVYDLIIARINADNKFRSKDAQLNYPHRSSVYRIINKIDPYTKTAARLGTKVANQRHLAIQKGIRPTRVLERVEIDHTKLDLFVIDLETKLPIGRPWLTTAIDVYSKMVVGFFLSFNPPSYLSIMQCLRHSITPKTYLAGKYPSIKNRWNAYGIPEMVVVDNGKEFYSSHFEDACLQLGILIQYAPTQLAWYKGTVERYFGTLNTQLLHNQPGTTFSNTFQKQDYDSTKNAVVSFETLIEIIHKWIIDVYHQKENKGIGDVPSRLWDTAVKDMPPILPAKGNCVDILLGQIAHRTISATGIELHGLFYNSEELALLRHVLKTGEKVTVKYDPCDLSVINVYDSIKNYFIPVLSTSLEYTYKLSLWQHKVIKEYARLRVKDYVDVVALSLAKEDIQKIVEAEWKSINKSTTKQRLARWKGQNNEGIKILSTEEKNITCVTQQYVSSGESLIGVSDLESSYESNFAPSNIPASDPGEKIPELIQKHVSKTEKQVQEKRKKKNNKISQISSLNMKQEDEFAPDLTEWSADYILKK